MAEQTENIHFVVFLLLRFVVVVVVAVATFEILITKQTTRAIEPDADGECKAHGRSR